MNDHDRDDADQYPSPDQVARSIVEDLDDRIDEEYVRNVDEGEAREYGPTSQMGQTPLWVSPYGKQRVPYDPKIAAAMREQADWGYSLVRGLAYANKTRSPVRSDQDRRRRLRRMLNMVNHFMGIHPDLAELEGRDELAELGLALDALDSGVTHALLRKPQGAGNKRPDTKLTQQFRVYVVAFAQILIMAGTPRPEAFSYIATLLTRVGAAPLKRADATETAGFNSDTIKRWFYAAQPEAEARKAKKDPSSDLGEKLGQRDSMLVSKMITGFVGQGVKDGEKMPPRPDYARAVIEATIADSSFKRLIPGAGA